MAAVGAMPRLSCRLKINMHCPCKGCDEKIQNAMASIRSFRGVEKSEGAIDTGMVTVTGKVNPEELCQWLKSKTRKDVQIVCPDLSAEIRKQKIISGRGSSSGTGSKTGKDVNIVCPDRSAEIRKQRIISGRGSSSETGSTTRSAPSLRSCQSLARSDRKTGKDVKIVCPDVSAENRKQIIISGRGSSSGTGSTAPSAPSLRRGVQSDRKNLQLVEDEIRDLNKIRDKLEIKCLKNELNAARSENRRSREVISDCQKALRKAY